MYIFIDSEFTTLSHAASLLSFAAVSEDGREFYCELAPLPLGECSDFVRANVLPLFTGGAATCPRHAFGERLGTWLAQFADPLLVGDSDWDIYVLHRAITGKSERRPGLVRFPIPGGMLACMLLTMAPLAGEEMAVFAAAQQRHFAADARRHHALVDARALRAGLLAVARMRKPT